MILLTETALLVTVTELNFKLANTETYTKRIYINIYIYIYVILENKNDTRNPMITETKAIERK